MAKRFTDTDKWKKPFIRKLPTKYKVLWFYIIDECDHAGIWQVDLEVAEIRTGEKFNEDEAKEIFEGKIIVFDNSEKWFIPSFIEFQYGELNSENRAHNSVINILSKYNLLDSNKPLTSPLQGAMDKDKEKDKDKDKEKTEFEKAFEAYLEMRKKIKKPATDYAIKLTHTDLQKLSKGVEKVKIEILNQSIKNNWAGVFELKKEKQEETTTPKYKQLT